MTPTKQSTQKSKKQLLKQLKPFIRFVDEEFNGNFNELSNYILQQHSNSITLTKFDDDILKLTILQQQNTLLQMAFALQTN